MKLSVVIPAYNEEALIGDCVLDVDRVLEALACDYEILVGNDGSADRTREVVEELGLPHVRVVNRPHRGKGAILTAALGECKGVYAGFIDADLEIAPDIIPRFVDALAEGYDAAVASKVLHPELQSQRSLVRRVSTSLYNRIVRLCLRTHLTDHQAGLKLFRSTLLQEVLPEVRCEDWLWDTEVLVHLLRRGARIIEIPVQALSVRDSHVSMVTTSLTMLRGLAGLSVRMRREGP